MTKLVNQRKTKRFQVNIGRGSPFGNPFEIGKHGDRQQCVQLYREYFYKRILTDTDFRDKVLSLRGKILACWCAPLECHGEIIIEYLEGLPQETRREKDNEQEFFT
jgi:hypothetical protein